MDIGTAEIAQDPENPAASARSQLVGGSDGGSRGGRGGGDDGQDPKQPTDEVQPSDGFIAGKSRILTAFLLLVVLMTFGGLIAAYVVLATNRSMEWRPFDLPIEVWISTVLIAVSSLVYHLGKRAVDRNDQPLAKRFLMATTLLGAAFISSQILAWLALVERGLYIRGNPYAGFFYILTAVHAVHVLGGIAALGSILLRVWNPTERGPEIEKRRAIAEVVGWYWHFMGLLWLVLFGLLGLWT